MIFWHIWSIKSFYIYRKIIHAINSRTFNNNQAKIWRKAANKHSVNWKGKRKEWENVSLSYILELTRVRPYIWFFYANEHFISLTKLNNYQIPPKEVRERQRWGQGGHGRNKYTPNNNALYTCTHIDTNEMKKEREFTFFVVFVV